MIIFDKLSGRFGNNIKINVKKLNFLDLYVIEKYFNNIIIVKKSQIKNKIFYKVNCHFQMTYLSKILKKEIKYYRKHF